MKIYQTINIGNKYEALEKEIQLLSSMEIDGIRFNLCKYSYDEISEACENILPIIRAYSNRYHFIFDLPYPSNKSRIVSFNIPEGMVKEGQVYYIRKYKEEEKEQPNTIYVQIEAFEEKILEQGILYYGDGECAFTINKIENAQIEVTATGDFKIHLNKAIMCGLIYNEQKNYEVANKILSSDCVKHPLFLLSFVTNKEQIDKFREQVSSLQDYGIISKIEAVSDGETIKEIIEASDGGLLARGDMALLNPITEIMNISRFVSKYCVNEDKRLFLATDVLTSLARSGFPNRADIVDLCFAKELECTDVIIPYGYKQKELFIKYINMFFSKQD